MAGQNSVRKLVGDFQTSIKTTFFKWEQLRNLFLPLIAAAVHQRVDAPVEHLVLGLESQDPERARQVVLAAAPVRLRQAAHLDVAASAPALAAPLGPRNAQHARQIPALSVSASPWKKVLF